MATPMPLHDLFLDELRDLYNGEKQLIKALPKLAKNATSDDLRAAIESHFDETEGQVQRLEQVFDLLGEKPRGKHCAGLAGIIEESNDLLQDDVDGAVLDAGIIAGAQRAEHYEIAAYGSVAAWAKAMGHDEVAELLVETLEEEKAADAKLTRLAEQRINAEAANGQVEMNGESRRGTRGRTTGNGRGASTTAHGRR